jgi:hypothetical protein
MTTDNTALGSGGTDTYASMMAEPASAGSHPDHESWTERFGRLASGSAPKAAEETVTPAPVKPLAAAPWFDAKLLGTKSPTERAAILKQGQDAYAKADPYTAAPASVSDLPHVGEMRMQLGIEAPNLPPQVQEMWDSEPMQDLERDALHYLGVEENVPKATIQRILDRYAERLVTGGRAFDPPGTIRPGDIEEWNTWLTTEAGLTTEQSKRLVEGFLWHHGLLYGPQKGK